ncbi:MAG: flagellar basal-body rod protein FlgF [Rhodospirillales bacterium]|nr:flagellar basal-body rod protein FlgF [Rhodospirillales bacterium]MCB9965267.1 flagellar basal-body rod protein FlgF [Rhodospirillales bacterium]MCB9972963.1 flagellar basal-body rod protein FlgF [Rhodospirillales bacterium]MCB9980049.1 flagellar basal-body rod protein FlgF [Rhodospirillales bacterium]
MENSLYVALSRQVGLDEKMAIVANNIANINTPGYRAQNMVFSEFLADPKGLKDPLSEVLDYGQYQSTAPGAIRTTENPLDVALDGPGYMGIQTAEGPAYSRNGRLSLNVNRELVNAAGLPVMDEGGNAISVPADAKEIIIAEDGSVSSQNGVIGKIKIVTFANEQDMEAKGNGVYITAQAEQPAENTRIIQGAYEESNVQAVLEMTRMIETSRAFQGTQNMLQSEHDRQRTMIQRLTRAG